ncbi:MAG: methyltransferase domain-containing protein, partial [Desulfuromonadales bacterium]|nr:methyltransferase domain-containing protein [Desulfuromonadales bacterium]
MTDWNARWREKKEQSFDPDPWLLQLLPLLPPGEALDIASGRGRNALWLAERGWPVVAVDASAEALAQLEVEAGRRRLPVRTCRIDLEAEPRLPGSFELVLQFFYLQRSLLPALLASVRPGGVAVLRTFSSAGPFPGGPGNSAFVLRPGELLEIFAGWDIVRHEE